MTPLHTTREVGEAIQKAPPSFETEHWHWWDKTGGTYRGIFDYVPHNPQGGWCYAPAPTLHETLIAIRELGEHTGEIGWSRTKIRKCQHTLLDLLIAADLDLSHPSVSEYLIRIFSEK